MNRANLAHHVGKLRKRTHRPGAARRRDEAPPQALLKYSSFAQMTLSS
jgi:hypothetical protein